MTTWRWLRCESIRWGSARLVAVGRRGDATGPLREPGTGDGTWDRGRAWCPTRAATWDGGRAWCPTRAATSPRSVRGDGPVATGPLRETQPTPVPSAAADQSQHKRRADASASALSLLGGDVRIRTGDKGFAGLCLTTWPRRRICEGPDLPALGNSWSGLRGSNPRPQPWQGCALPTALSPRAGINIREPPTQCKNFFDFFGNTFVCAGRWLKEVVTRNHFSLPLLSLPPSAPSPAAACASANR